MPLVAEKLRIMIVEDEPDIALILREVLSPLYEVVCAANGLEALERIGRYEPDITIMDLMMPVLDGFDTTRAIKKDQRFSHMPVLFLTARKDNDAVRNALLAGGDFYLEKPFHPPELITRISEIIARNRVMPRRKQSTVPQAEAFFGAQAAEASQAQQPPPRPVTQTGMRSQRPLTEQLQAQAADLRVRVLAVDDDQDVLNFTRTILAEEYEVITTADSEQAPDKIIAYQPDILLLDIQMPRLNGFHLSHLIRLNKRLRGSKVIYVSSRSDKPSIEKAFALGASDYIEKPFTPEQLRRKIRDVISKPDFQRIKKRLEYREILRREGLEESSSGSRS